jgi:hypothetical protein
MFIFKKINKWKNTVWNVPTSLEVVPTRNSAPICAEMPTTTGSTVTSTITLGT